MDLRKSFRAEERREKSDITARGVAGLLTINGGGAVAAGSLLAAVIDKPRAAELLPFIINGIVWTTAGVVAAAAIFIAQYCQIILQQRGYYRFKNLGWWAAWALVAVSLFCFARGMFLTAVEASRFVR